MNVGPAAATDLREIVRLLADDPLGARCERVADPLPRVQIEAFAIALAREVGCGLVQLTTDKSRHDAQRFFQRLGFVASHEGMKLPLEP